jgi:hypothetical protein
MPEDQMPLWARQFQSEMLRGLSDLRDTIKDAVSRDTFRDEKDRVNGEFIKVYEELKSARDENKDLATKLQAESTARGNAELAAANKVGEEAKQRQRVQAQTNWQWLLILIVPIVDWVFDLLKAAP